MKFVVRSLLFVNLLLQMTNSLKSCFDHDQNIMITIILLAFSAIGLIGLVIGNRFILIIFSASMTLILIASITIYAIGKTEEDSLKPKVPYYIDVLPDQDTRERTPLKNGLSRNNDDDGGNKLKSLVDKWLNKRNDQSRNRNGRYNKTRTGSRMNNQRQKNNLKKGQLNPSLLTTTITPAILDELSDEPNGVIHQNIQGPLIDQNSPNSISNERSMAKIKDQSFIEMSRDSRLATVDSSSDIKLPSDSNNRPNVNQVKFDSNSPEMEEPIGEQVESEQWKAYERYLYERYLKILSQSIDLIMHTILAAWMALLLDEDSDQCFGPKSSSRKSRSGSLKDTERRASSAKELPVYNYNGVRYSIRPDVDESPTHIVVH